MTERGGVLGKLQEMEKRATGKVSAPVDLSSPSPAQQVAQVIQLPLWPEAVRGVPNSVLRSALFGAIKRGRRAYLQREALASVDGVTVLFTGPRLDQADLDVWEQCLHLARGKELGERVQFSAHGFLRAIDRSAGGKDIEWLKGAFARLSASVVEIKDGNRAYFGAMLHGGARDDETGAYSIEINPKIVALYGREGWSHVEWQQRLGLKGQPLAQWVHGFYITHAMPFPYRVETLHKLCGSEAKNLKDFRKDLRKALAHIQEVAGWSGSVSRDGLVTVEKTPSKSQKRHLTKKTNSERRKKPRATPTGLKQIKLDGIAPPLGTG